MNGCAERHTSGISSSVVAASASDLDGRQSLGLSLCESPSQFFFYRKLLSNRALSIGDALEVLLSLILVWKASKIDGGLPRTTKLRMYFNIALDFAIGFIPFLGDLFDIGYRANTRNAWILNNHFVEKLAKIPEKGGNSANGSNDRDLERGLEQGVELMQTAQGVPSAPTAVPPARTPAPKAAIPPGRNLTGRVRDPRDRK